MLRRSFLGNLFGGSVVGFLGTNIITGNEIIIEPSKKLKFFNAAHRIFNCSEEELNKHTIFVYGENFTLPCPRPKIDRDLEKLVCVFNSPYSVKRTMALHGVGIRNPEGIEIARAKYSSTVSCVMGDILKNTYTLSV